MFHHDGLVIVKLIVGQIDGEQGTYRRSAHPQEAKKLQGPRGIVQQKFYDEQIQKHADGAANPVIGPAALAVKVFDGDFGNFCAARAGQRRDEAMQFAVQLNFLDNLAPVSLEGGSEVVEFDAREFRHHPVGREAGKLAREPGVFALVAPAADQVVAFLDFFHEARDLCGGRAHSFARGIPNWKHSLTRKKSYVMLQDNNLRRRK